MAKTFVFAWLDGGSWMLILEFPGVAFQDIYWTCRAHVGGGFKSIFGFVFGRCFIGGLVLKLTGRYF